MPVEGDELRNDHLSPHARAQHRNLLIAASVAFLFVALEPKRVSAIGVDLDTSNRGWLLLILLAAVVYFGLAFFAASRADYHIWRRSLSAQRVHLDSLRDETAFDRDHAQLDRNLQDGEDGAVIAGRRDELEATRDRQRSTREHLIPVVRWFALRGWIDFWLALVYATVIACVLLYELRQLA